MKISQIVGKFLLGLGAISAIGLSLYGTVILMGYIAQHAFSHCIVKQEHGHGLECESDFWAGFFTFCTLAGAVMICVALYTLGDAILKDLNASFKKENQNETN